MIVIKAINEKIINIRVEGSYRDIKDEYLFLKNKGLKDIEKELIKIEEKMEKKIHEYKKL